MKKLLLGLALAGSLSTQAVVIDTWVDLDTLGVVLGPGASYSDDFNIAGGDGGPLPDKDGFQPGIDTLLGAEVAFDFVRFTGGIGTPSSASYVLGSGGDFGAGGTLLGTFILGGGVILELADLNADGILTYKVTNTGSNDIRVDSARLDAIGLNVPDGGSTVMLLGSTLMGMATLARRKK